MNKMNAKVYEELGCEKTYVLGEHVGYSCSGCIFSNGDDFGTPGRECGIMDGYCPCQQPYEEEMDTNNQLCSNCPLTGSRCPQHYWECLMDQTEEDKPTIEDCVEALQEYADSLEERLTEAYWVTSTPPNLKTLEEYAKVEHIADKVLLLNSNGITLYVERNEDQEFEFDINHPIFENVSPDMIWVIPIFETPITNCFNCPKAGDCTYRLTGEICPEGISPEPY